MGIRVITGTMIERIEESHNGHYLVYPANHGFFCVDKIIVAAGVRPNIGFVDFGRIDTDVGILVNDKMQTSMPEIYAAGDVAQGPTALEGSHVVHALWTTAIEQGKVAGANMAGKEVVYQGSLGSWVVEFFHITVASVGILQESSQVKAKEFFDPERKFYTKLFLEGAVPVGGIMLGSPEDVSSFGILKSCILRTKPLPRTDIMTTPAIPLRLNFGHAPC